MDTRVPVGQGEGVLGQVEGVLGQREDTVPVGQVEVTLDNLKGVEKMDQLEEIDVDQLQANVHISMGSIREMVDSWLPLEYQIQDKPVVKQSIYSTKSSKIKKLKKQFAVKKQVQGKNIPIQIQEESKLISKKPKLVTDPLAKYLARKH